MRVLVACILCGSLVSIGCRADDASEQEATPSPVATATPTAVPEIGTPEPGTVSLQIASPRPDEEAASPMSVRYTMSGLEPPARLLVSADGSAPIAVELRSSTGEVFVEGLPEGRWDLRFQLATADGSLIDDPGATVTVPGVTITERGAGGGGIGY